MEVEAKFIIPNQDAMLRLQRVVRLGPFVPGDAAVRETTDVYLDTSDRTLLGSGYACRIRQEVGERWLTVKGLGGVEAAIHKRFESEEALPAQATADVATWPEGQARELVARLIGDEPLLELLVVEQVRQVRLLHKEGRLVAELSLDRAVLRVGERQKRYQCLEAELTGEGEIGDLRILTEHLAGTWGLEPESRSKFELGLALLEPETRAEKVVPEASEEGGQESEPAVSPRPVQDDGQAAERITDNEERAQPGVAQVAEEEASPGEETWPESRERVGAIEGDSKLSSVEELCARFQVDMAHARYVKEVALLLFDRTEQIHHLGAEQRRLLAIMATLHNVGLEVDPDRHHVCGRDIVLENPLEELTEMEQRMLAAAVYLHRKRARRRKLETGIVASLPLGMRHDTLVLAALVRMADGLDASQGQSTKVEGIQVRPSGIEVVAAGPFVEVDVSRAQAKADLWEMLFGETSFFFAVRGAEGRQSMETGVGHTATTTGWAALEEPLQSPGILPDDPMSEAGRKVLAFHFARMLVHEPGTRAGVDVEELHDMRVATRRMRSAFRVFGPYFKARSIRPYVVGLRRTARALGRVRDLDVFLQKAGSYLDGLDEDRVHDLDLLLLAWRDQRESARATMIGVLDSNKYREFVDAFRLFLETPGAGARQSARIPPRPTLVRHVAPQLIYGRWASVQAFGPLLEGAPISILHALRIECKRLRYTLEFFSEVLAPSAKDVIEVVIKLQDHLGDLNDADVANDMLSDFLFAPGARGEGERVIAPGVVAYLAVKQQELQMLAETFPQAWQAFNRPDIRKALADSVATL